MAQNGLSEREIIDGLEARRYRPGDRRNELDDAAAALIRKLLAEKESRRSMIDQTVRAIRNGMVEVKPEELQLISRGLHELQGGLFYRAEVSLRQALGDIEKRNYSQTTRSPA